MTSKQRRIDEIKARVRAGGSCAIRDLAEALGVTTMTIRRDLEGIPETDGFMLVRGVLFYTGGQGQQPGNQYSLITAKTERAGQKTRIARAAFPLLSPGDSIIVDAGSTIEYPVNTLPADLPV